MNIDTMLASDWPSVSAIYADGIATGNATFETSVPSWEQWDASHAGPRLVARDDDGAVLGWAALSRVSSRAVYAGVAEVSVYVSSAARGRGIGAALLGELVRQSEAQGFWTLQASIFPENTASIRLHERFGFRLLGRRERIAKHHGVWRDTVIMERRSGAVE